jgi:putative ABC transport system permease protein
MRAMCARIALEAWSDFSRVSTKAILALIGVSVGVAAVIAMQQIGHAARSEAERQFRSLGTDLVLITPRPVNGQEVLLPLDLPGDLRRDYAQIMASAAVAQRALTVRVGLNDLQSTLIAASEDLYDVLRASVTVGRQSFDLDGRAAYAVMGAELARQIGALRGRPVEIGDRFDADDETVTVIGLLDDLEPASLLALDLNRSIVIPFGAASRFSTDFKIGAIAIRLDATASEAETTAALRERFDAMFRKDVIEIRAARQLLGELDRQMRIYSRLLFAIGALALLVGGVGVMNVMLMSVLERTQEIGLRRALGARRRDIQAMFLAEAVLLSGLGAMIGTGLGVALGWLASTRSNWAYEPAPMTIPLGVGMAMAIGLFSGLYPAMRAARLDPIQALRG